MTLVRWWSPSLSQLYRVFLIKIFSNLYLIWDGDCIWLWSGFLKSFLQEQKLTNKHRLFTGQGLKFFKSSTKEFWRLDSNICHAPTSNKPLASLNHYPAKQKVLIVYLEARQVSAVKGVRMPVSDWSMLHNAGLWLAQSWVWEGCWWHGPLVEVIMNLNRLLAPAIIIIWTIHSQAINKCWRRHKQGAELRMRGLILNISADWVKKRRTMIFLWFHKGNKW